MSENNGPRTVIGPDARVKGEIHSGGDLVVQGRVEGSLSVDAVLFIETAGLVEAEVDAHHVVIAGTFKGNLVARDALEVAETGRVQGRVTAPRMLVADGGILNAEISMSGEAAPAAMTEGEAVEAQPAKTATRSVYTYSVPEPKETYPSREPATEDSAAVEVIEAAVPATKTKKGGKKKS